MVILSKVLRLLGTVVLVAMFSLSIYSNMSLRLRCTESATAYFDSSVVDNNRYKVTYIAKLEDGKKIHVKSVYSDKDYPDTISVKYNPDNTSEYIKQE
jgi:hypothetical protein